MLDLMGAASADQPVDSGDSGEVLDERSRREYRRRLESLRAQLEEAESHRMILPARKPRARKSSS